MGDTDILLKIETDLSDSAKRIAELTIGVKGLSAQEEQLKKIIKETTETEGKNSEVVKVAEQRIAAITEAKKAYKKEIGEVSRSVQNAIISDVEYQNSLKGQAALLSQLKDQLRAMPLIMDENGNIAKQQSDEYEALSQRIRKLSDDIGRQEQAYGTYSRNVGNYANSIIDAASSMGGSFGGAVTGIRNATTALNLMSKTPVVAILGLVVTALSKVIAGLKGSEENSNRVTAAFGGLKAIGDVLTIALQGLGKAIGAVSEWIAKIFKQVAERVPQLEEVNARMEERNRLAREEIELNKQQRQSSIDVAENELKVSELRAKASDKETYTAQERLDYLNEALATELEISHQRFEVAQKEYELIRDKNAQTESSKEQLDAEAQAQVKMIEAQRTYYEMERSMQRQIVSAKREIKAEEKQIADERKRQNEEAKKAQEEALKVQQGLLKDYLTLSQTIADKLVTDELQTKINGIKREYKTLAQDMKKAVAEGTMTFEEATYYQVLLTNRMNEDIEQAQKEHDAKQESEAERTAKEQMQARKEQLDTDLKLAWQNEEQKFNIKAKYINDELALEELSAERRAELEEQLATLYAQHTQKKLDALTDFISDCGSLLTDFNGVVKNLNDKEVQDAEEKNDAEKEALKKRLDAGLISQKNYDKQVAKLDADLDKKKAEITRQQAIRERALSVFDIAVNTAKAIIKIWAEVPKFDYGVSTGVLTALAAAQGAIQTAAVLSAPLPKARRGGLVQGATHEQGGVLIEAENDERIIGANPSRAFPELLNLISYIGKNIPNSGYADRQVLGVSKQTISMGGIDYAMMKQAMAEAVAGLKIYTSLTELREAEAMHTTIDTLSKL